jgi:very-short-patch-repair endonuclease
MERNEEFVNWTPSCWGTRRPDFDGFYRTETPDTDNERPRDRAGLEPIAVAALSALETIEIAIEIGPLCDSEIEIDLAIGLTKGIRIIDDPTLSVGHQFPLRRFLYDLYVKRAGRSKPLVLVECDGKEFHSTADQIKNDHAKDVLADKSGIPLFRFSGSEIFRELDRCVAKVFKALRRGGHIAASDWDALEAARVV